MKFHDYSIVELSWDRQGINKNNNYQPNVVVEGIPDVS
jgi:hypothetical protein